MRLRPLRLLGLALLVGALALGAACTDDDGDDSAGAGGGSPAPTVETGTPGEGTPGAGSGAAGGGIEPANPASPPEGRILAASGEVDLGLGSYCWSPPTGGGEVGHCADAIGIITGTEDLTVSPGETLTVTGDLAMPPMTISTARLHLATDEPIDAQPEFRAWQPNPDAVSQSLEVDSSTTGEHTVALPDDLEPGRYVLDLSYTAGPDRGSDAQYGVVLVVE